MIYLDKEDIVFINQRTVAEHGGNSCRLPTFCTRKILII